MLPLRFPWLWWSLGLLLVAGVCIGSLVPSPVMPYVFSIGDKLLHAGSYFLLMVWFAGLFHRSKYFALAAVLILLGALLDLLQGTIATRSFDTRDVIANSLGVGVGLLLSWVLLEGWCRRVEQWLLP